MKTSEIKVPILKKCNYGDPYCPCQDGDSCHYEGNNSMNQYHYTPYYHNAKGYQTTDIDIVTCNICKRLYKTRNEKTSYECNPLPDITVYELALILPVFTLSLAGGDTINFIENLPDEAKRHFRDKVE